MYLLYVFCAIFPASSQNFAQYEADEPSTSSSGLYVSQQNQVVVEESTSNETPLKQKPAKPPSSPLYDNECASPVPIGMEDDDSN